jgi:threonine/homoserine/homoserine lactone efflux protein/CheY-like chemotaxis protein
MKNCAEDVVSEFSRGFSKAFYAGYRTKRRFGSYPQVFNFEHHFPWEVAVGQSIPFRATALIVEDDPSQREMLSLLLEESDFDVIQCESAEAAELVLAKNGSALSLMVTDVNLAGPMNGVETAPNSGQNRGRRSISCARRNWRRQSRARDLAEAGRAPPRSAFTTWDGVISAHPMSLSFLLTSLIVVASPGTGVLYTLAAALTKGSRASIAAAFGCTLGILPHLAAAMLGLAAVLHASALAFAALKWCGVLYLLYMAWQSLREHGALAVDTRVEARSNARVIVTGFLINILNPKLSIFFLAFLPQFISTEDAHPLARMLELSAAFMAMTLVVFVLYGLFAASVRDRVISRPKVMAWLRRAFAGGFALLGARLAFAER